LGRGPLEAAGAVRIESAKQVKEAATRLQIACRDLVVLRRLSYRDLAAKDAPSPAPAPGGAGQALILSEPINSIASLVRFYVGRPCQAGLWPAVLKPLQPWHGALAAVVCFDTLVRTCVPTTDLRVDLLVGADVGTTWNAPTTAGSRNRLLGAGVGGQQLAASGTEDRLKLVGPSCLRGIVQC